MKKLKILSFFILINTFILFNVHKVYAASVDIPSNDLFVRFACWIYDDRVNNKWFFIQSNNSYTANFYFSGTSISISNIGQCTIYTTNVGNYNGYFNPSPPFEKGSLIDGYSYTENNPTIDSASGNVIIIKGNYNPNNANVMTLEEYYAGESWVIQAWDVFKDYMSGEPFHWIKSLGDFWKNRFTDLRGFWNNLFHKDSNGDIQQDMNIISPTPLPPTPTPIPYSTIVVYDSTTNSYIYKYEYTDNNNNTIIATSPPEQPNSGSGNGENIKDDYYPSDPLDVPRDNGMWSPQFTINLGDGDSIDIDLNTMNDTLIQGAEPYLDDIDASTDLFGAIPQDWFFLIGFCAIIPLICGIINRFLG